MTILENLSDIKNDDKVALFIRHSERYLIPKGDIGNQVLLTENGKRKAEKYGEDLRNYTVNKIFSSPVERCMQTARSIASGYAKSIKLEPSKLLGEPGTFISDEKLADISYTKLGGELLTYNYLTGKDIPGFCYLEEGAQRLLEFIQNQTQKPGITIFISHDNFIAFFCKYLNYKTTTSFDWVKFLSGIILKF